MVRDGRIDDLESLLPIFKVALKGTRFRSDQIDEVHIRRLLAVGATTPNFFLQVVEGKKGIVGVLGGYLDTNTWGVKVATDMIFYSKRETDTLIRNFRKWAKDNGAAMVSLTDLSGNPRFRNLILSLGLEERSRTYIQEI